MSDETDLVGIMQPSGRVRSLRRALDVVTDRPQLVLDLSRPYVDGLENLPPDGRFLLVGNHTQFGSEVFLIPDMVRRSVGTRVRPLADRNFGRLRGLPADLMAAFGGVIGAPETVRELMRHDETILVFPGGGREIAKFKGEEYALRWQGRSGFARVSVANGYPIVPVGLVGGDDVYRSLTTRDSAYAKFSAALSRRLNGRPDMVMPLLRGIGPTLIPRPQRMYLRFGAPIDTTTPLGVENEQWVDIVKERTRRQLEIILSELLRLREKDPYRGLNPLAWHRAATA
ncbi:MULTISPECIES: lysophospholipid acyltransferase family protein [Mycobacterium avium complex (MAC)]|uniref:Lysophospholipid acyltransferase family protein n=2 Tax=Mycobacterium intracellulare TaxID=1767 RepID=A0AAE4UCV8_MYCIT|nr:MULTISPECIES: lysophospholipid acyltransferase family protein [Mycobacterium avium complex (MAC)]AFS14487.1 Acyltransferase-like protein [Mycobacterium intracellulare subsp. intracellulare MTCC 9506]ETZ30281.1 diacylglycerol acyltransferase family protein [Mycobacterium intracellulare MIN_052511_1280]MCA2321498.1 acyltransferase family protein [Mycobacterium intracellulare]MCA2340925.1 acyltransferase family protein [Mycobacterium intracellulare]MDV6975855.1 lysophospholipid acyltransferase